MKMAQKNKMSGIPGFASIDRLRQSGAPGANIRMAIVAFLTIMFTACGKPQIQHVAEKQPVVIAPNGPKPGFMQASHIRSTPDADAYLLID